MLLIDFLTKARTVTNNYIQAWGSWRAQDQWRKIAEEDQEFREAITKENKLEEFWDCFFARLTLLHIDGFVDNDILAAGIDKLRIINERSEKAVKRKQSN